MTADATHPRCGSLAHTHAARCPAAPALPAVLQAASVTDVCGMPQQRKRYWQHRRHLCRWQSINRSGSFWCCCKGAQEADSKECRQAGANKTNNCTGATRASTGSSTGLEIWPASELWHRLASSQALVRLLSRTRREHAAQQLPGGAWLLYWPQAHQHTWRTAGWSSPTCMSARRLWIPAARSCVVCVRRPPLGTLASYSSVRPPLLLHHAYNTLWVMPYWRQCPQGVCPGMRC